MLRDDIDYNTPTYFQKELNDLKKQCEKEGVSLLVKLEEHAAQIEYIDSTETENLFMSRDMKTFTDEHTHSEIHPSVMLSYVFKHTFSRT